MSTVSKQTFFSISKIRFPFLKSFYKQITKLPLVGRVLEIHLSFDVIPFVFSLFLKSGGYRYFSFFLKTYTYDGVCVAVKSRGFASSLTVRAVDAGFTYDRFILLFSPLLIKLKYVRPVVSGAKIKNTFKAKMYFLKAISQKRLIAKLFK